MTKFKLTLEHSDSKPQMLLEDSSTFWGNSSIFESFNSVLLVGATKNQIVVSTVMSGILFARFSTVECIPTKSIAPPIESEISFSTGTFLNNNDVINRKL